MADQTTPTEVEKPVEQTAPETPVEQTEPVLSPRAQKLKEFGFENVKDDDEAFDRLLTYSQQLKNDFGSQLQQALEQVKSQAQPTTAQVQEAQSDSWWNPPKVDTALVAKYRTQDGNWKPETPADIRQQAEAAQAYYDRWAVDLVQRPNEVLPKLIRQEAERIVDERMGQTQQQQQFSQLQNKIFTENTWLFESDPVTGNPNRNALSAEGKLIDQYMAEAQQRGADYEFAWEFAISKHQAAKAAIAAKTASKSETAAETNTRLKRESIVRAGGSPNRTGSLPAPSENRVTQRNRNLTFGQRAAQVADANGSA